MEYRLIALAASFALCCGCATIKQSDTARTGVEQLLVSSAIDKSLDRIDFRPISGAAVYVEQKYLDCVDKNYVLVATHQRLLKSGCTLVEKPEDALAGVWYPVSPGSNAHYRRKESVEKLCGSYLRLLAGLDARSVC